MSLCRGGSPICCDVNGSPCFPCCSTSVSDSGSFFFMPFDKQLLRGAENKTDVFLAIALQTMGELRNPNEEICAKESFSSSKY